MAQGIKKILIAEDEKPMLHAMQIKLEHAGFEVVAVENGIDALDELKKKSFDLLILDLMMPEMDGWGVLESLKKQGSKTVIIVSTNLSQEEDEKRAREYGAKDFIVKSNTPLTEIISRIQKVI